MNYLVNGEVLTRKELVDKVLEVALDTSEEKLCLMYIYNGNVEHIKRRVHNRAYNIALALGWEIESLPRK